MTPTSPPSAGRPPRLLIRPDAGRLQGSGHVMRSLAVAEAAKREDFEVFLSADLSELDWLRPWADSVVTELVAPAASTGELRDLVATLSASAVLLDHYGFADAKAEVAAGGAILVNLEDDSYGRRPAHIVVDYSLGAETTARPDDGSDVLLRGISFAPLREQVVRARSRRAEFGGSVEEVAVLMGGTDPLGLRPAVAGALEQAGVSVTSAAPGLGFLDQVALADAVVSAAGSSAYEMCCLGMPIGLVQVADNQLPNYQRLVNAGAATGLGDGAGVLADPAAFAARISAWLADTTRLAETSSAAHGLLDGRGASRIVSQIAHEIRR